MRAVALGWTRLADEKPASYRANTSKLPPLPPSARLSLTCRRLYPPCAARGVTLTPTLVSTVTTAATTPTRSYVLPVLGRGYSQLITSAAAAAASVRMPPKQATLGSFFKLPPGTKPPVKEQAKLSFATKAKKKDDDTKTEKEASSSKDGDVDMAGVDDAVPEKEVAAAATSDSETKKTSRKRKSPERETGSTAATADGSGDDDEPVVKRKRGRPKKVESSPEPEPEPAKSADEGAEADKSTGKKDRKGKKAKKDTAATTADKQDGEEAPEKKKKGPKSPPSSPKGKARKSPSPSAGVDKLTLEQPEEESGASARDSDDEDQSALVKKAEQVKQLIQSKKHPYPDWAEGGSVPYAALCKTFELIDGTRKRLEITAHTSKFLQQVIRLSPHELVTVVHLMLNKLAADYMGIELGIGESLIMKAISESTGRTMDKLKAMQAKIGDLGMIAYQSRNAQPTLIKMQPLTVERIFKGLYRVATTKGDGTMSLKVAEIKKLLAACQGEEAKFLVRGLEGKLRLGLADQTVLQAVAQAAITREMEAKGKTPKATDLVAAENMLKEVFSGLPSYEVIIPKIIEHGIMNLKEHCTMQPGVPLKPMLAKPAKSISEVLDRFDNLKFTCEFKYDGERAQIHYVSTKAGEKEKFAVPGKDTKKGGGLTAIFSRNSEDLSTKYPDILAVLNNWVSESTTSFILDCETTAFDKDTGKLLPFQTLMTRKRKDVAIEDVKIKVCVYAFDLLFLNGEALVHKSLTERREAMKAAFNEVEGQFGFARHADVDQVDEIQSFLEESVKGQCEGLMVKMLNGEASHYTPSKRSQNWLKIKKDYLAGAGDSLDLVVLGAYHGKGKRTSVYGAFLLACYNPTAEKYETICNIGTGFSDEVLASLHEQLEPFIIPKPKPFYSHSTVAKDQPDVWFEPRVVWEVLCADLTLSPRYKAAADNVADPTGKGVSLRFPRYIREREDKKPDAATTARQVAEMYRAQESVGGKGKGGVDDDWEY
ncbi:hypothetical protein Dda_1704 [Drechslerella dactyloides]|uniref:DNA ligase n=1 Tax=Drechslerella dactyloides TaxID=74499 RepID=A0AAD6J265_DREDA|nr:hypothetical protein Dda_1704 [Drechslerella dactyloides]